MRRALQLSNLGAALLLLSAPAAMAMSFGRTATATTLGQPLDFIAQVALDGDETVTRECVAARVTAGDNRIAAENVRVTLEDAHDPGMRAIRVTTRTAVNEPVVTIDLTVGCRSQMSRRFVAFVDPPALRLASAEPASLSPQRVDPQVAPLLDIVGRADPARARVAARADASRDGELDSRRGTRRTVPGRRMRGRSDLGGRRRPSAPIRCCAQIGNAGPVGRSRDRPGPRHATPAPRRRLRRLPESARQRRGRSSAPRRRRQEQTRPARRRSRRPLPRSKPHRRRWRRNAPTSRSSRRALRDCAVIRWRSRRRSARCRRACARPRAIATSTGSSIRSLRRCCSSPCSRPPSGRCGRASVGARAGSTRRPTSRSAPLPLPPPRCGRARATSVHADTGAGDQPAPFAVGRERARDPAGDGAGDDRRPRSDDGARAAVALRAHGRSRRVRQRRRSDA